MHQVSRLGASNTKRGSLVKSYSSKASSTSLYFRNILTTGKKTLKRLQRKKRTVKNINFMSRYFKYTNEFCVHKLNISVENFKIE